MKLRFADTARSELHEAALYLEAEGTGLGIRFLDAVDAARKQILAAPLVWHPPGQGLRRCHLKRFRYGLIYRIRGQAIEIIAVAHDSRAPVTGRLACGATTNAPSLIINSPCLPAAVLGAGARWHVQINTNDRAGKIHHF